MAKHITEEQVDMLVERLLNRVEKANVYFLKNIGAYIKKVKNLSPSKAQQLIQILKYGGNYDDIVRQLAKHTDLNVKDIDDIFNQYAKKDQMFYKQFYEHRNIPFVPYESNMLLQTQTKALANIVKNEMYNFTRQNILGYTINGTFHNLRETYNSLLDEALMNVGQGKETFDGAMKKILSDIGGSGLKTLDYESGRSIRLDSAIRMHLKGRLRELHNENQKIYGDEFGADGIEISVHSNPAEDHELVQGRQFSLSEYEKLNSGLEAKDYKGKTYTLDHDGKNGYRPISEMNCYHYIFSIILGVSKPEYSDEQLNQIINDNDKGFMLDGKHYTMYEGTQLQRSLEREIRKQKDIQILAKASGNEELTYLTQQNITKLSNKYKELSNVSGLPIKSDRLRISGYRRTKTNIGDNLQRDTKNIVGFTKYANNKVFYIDRIDLNNEKLLNNKIREYRSNILHEEKENAYVIDKNGDVFYIKGNNYTVNFPDWLDRKDSIIMHNHPKKETNYSFSIEDVGPFLNNNVNKLFGDDLEYEYLIEKTNKTIHNIERLETDWNNINYKATELSMNNKLDINKDGYHYIVKELAKKYNFKYRRNKQKLFDKK